MCPERVPLFEGSQGVILSGKVGPAPLEGVSISVLLEGGEVIHTVTDHQGQYRWANEGGTILVQPSMSLCTCTMLVFSFSYSHMVVIIRKLTSLCMYIYTLNTCTYTFNIPPMIQGWTYSWREIIYCRKLVAHTYDACLYLHSHTCMYKHVYVYVLVYNAVCWVEWICL